MTGPTRRQCYRGAKIWPVWSLPWRTGRATRGEDDASRHCLADGPLRGLLWRPPISVGRRQRAKLSANGWAGRSRWSVGPNEFGFEEGPGARIQLAVAGSKVTALKLVRGDSSSGEAPRR